MQGAKARIKIGNACFDGRISQNEALADDSAAHMAMIHLTGMCTQS